MIFKARCRECNAKVWRNAEYCQRCGVRYPAKGDLLLRDSRPRGSARRVITLFLAICVLGWIGAKLGSGGNSGRMTTTVPSCETDWMRCANNSDLVNIYLKNYSAQDACKAEAIERARYGDPKFPSLYYFGTFYTGDEYPKTGIAILIEKDAQYQNGFGAMAHSQVTCTYDLRAKRVVSVDISPR
jgi:hypothetical protein